MHAWPAHRQAQGDQRLTRAASNNSVEDGEQMGDWHEPVAGGGDGSLSAPTPAKEERSENFESKYVQQHEHCCGGISTTARALKAQL